MKKAIAMRCTQEQFEAIKPKLESQGIKLNVHSGFNFFPYLTNPHESISNYVGNYRIFDTKSIREIYETWNEKIFLEACGISTVPTIEEIKEHFQNAKTVKCLDDGDEYVIDLSKEIIYQNGNICIDDLFEVDNNDRNASCCYVWNDKKGFAKIISYKKPRTNKLTELEKRVEVLEAKQKQESVINIPNRPLKFFPPIPNYSKGKVESIAKTIVDAIDHNHLFINEAEKIVQGLKPEDFTVNGIPLKEWSEKNGFSFNITTSDDRKPFPSFNVVKHLENYRQENSDLKNKIKQLQWDLDLVIHQRDLIIKRIEELEAENKMILASGTWPVHKIKLEVGKWHTDKYNRLFVPVKIADSKNCLGYGFGCVHNGFISLNDSPWEINGSEELATEAEVLEALKNEAIKRDIHNSYHKCLDCPNLTISNPKKEFWLKEDGSLWIGERYSANCIFKDGIWAK